MSDVAEHVSVIALYITASPQTFYYTALSVTIPQECQEEIKH